IAMSTKCIQCGASLRSFVAFNFKCKACGARYRAVRRKSTLRSALAGLHAASIVLYLPYLMWSPFSGFVNFAVVPVSYIFLGVLISMKGTTWVLVTKGSPD